MRLIGSALSAATGTLLLGVAIFGQPNVYLRNAKQQLYLRFDDAFGSEPAAAAGDPTAQALSCREAELQLQVVSLQRELLQLERKLDQSRVYAAIYREQLSLSGKDALELIDNSSPTAQTPFTQHHDVNRHASEAQDAALSPRTLGDVPQQTADEGVPGSTDPSTPEPAPAASIAPPLRQERGRNALSPGRNGAPPQDVFQPTVWWPKRSAPGRPHQSSRQLTPNGLDGGGG